LSHKAGLDHWYSKKCSRNMARAQSQCNMYAVLPGSSRSDDLNIPNH
jgi:hypothetical protein